MSINFKTAAGVTVTTTAFLLLAVNTFAATPQPRTPKSSDRPNIASQGGNLNQGKLRACEAKEQAIKRRSQNMASALEKMMNAVDGLSQRTQQYYDAKVVPSGKVLNNYAELLADSETKKASASGQINMAKEAVVDFDCDAPNPSELRKGLVADMKNAIEAVKAYHKSVRIFMLAVRTVVPADSGEEEEVQP